MPGFSASVLFFFTMTASGPIELARQHMLQGQLEETLFDFQGRSFAGLDRLAASEVMIKAASLAIERKDDLLALQFAQMALQANPDQPVALHIAATLSLNQEQFTAAENYSDRWMRVDPTSSPAKLLRAQIASMQGEWERVLGLVDHLAESGFDENERKLLAALRTRARDEIAQRDQGIENLHAMERQLTAASRSANEAARRPAPEAAPATVHSVVLYGANWCGPCRMAKRWFRENRIAFVEKDIDQDVAAADELEEKMESAGLQPGGIPVIEVDGRLVVGFNADELERLLL
jgi:glutaredoxin